MSSEAVVDVPQGTTPQASQEQPQGTTPQASQEQQGNGPIQSVETIREQFDLVAGSERTEQAGILGKMVSDAMVGIKGITARKEWLQETAKQVCGRYADDSKLVRYAVLHHVSLHCPGLKLLGLSFALKVLGATGAKFDFKNCTDDLNGQSIERINYILPLLYDGIDGLGCNSKGNPDRAAWCKIVKGYLATGIIPKFEPAQADEGKTDDAQADGKADDAQADEVARLKQENERLLDQLAHASEDYATKPMTLQEVIGVIEAQDSAALVAALVAHGREHGVSALEKLQDCIVEAGQQLIDSHTPGK